MQHAGLTLAVLERLPWNVLPTASRETIQFHPSTCRSLEHRRLGARGDAAPAADAPGPSPAQSERRSKLRPVHSSVGCFARKAAARSSTSLIRRWRSYSAAASSLIFSSPSDIRLPMVPWLVRTSLSLLSRPYSQSVRSQRAQRARATSCFVSNSPSPGSRVPSPRGVSADPNPTSSQQSGGHAFSVSRRKFGTNEDWMGTPTAQSKESGGAVSGGR